MKVLALNGSPRGKNSSTYRLLLPLLEGMALAGAETTLINLANENISPCTGCFACWTTTPEKCIIEDEMDNLLKTYVESDLVIYGTPLHTYQLSSLMKQFIDRCFPLHTSIMIKDDKASNASTLYTRHSKPSKLMLVANCGFPEYDHFDPLLYYFKFLANMLDKEYLGAILQPMGEILKKPTMQGYLQPYFVMLRKIGKAVIETGSLAEAQLEQLRAKWVIKDPKDYQDLANFHYQQKQELYEKNQLIKQADKVPNE